MVENILQLDKSVETAQCADCGRVLPLDFFSECPYGCGSLICGLSPKLDGGPNCKGQCCDTAIRRDAEMDLEELQIAMQQQINFVANC